ncbi:MAG: MotA/TolQ/ExbB proton channel family protein [Bacteriovoracia bacterium]
MNTEIDIWHLILHASFTVKFILLLLSGGSIWSWAIFLKKRKLYKLLTQQDHLFLQVYQNDNKLSEIAAKAEDYPASPCATIYKQGHQELMRILGKISESDSLSMMDYFERFGATAIERSLRQGVNLVNGKMEERLSSLASIGSIAPFVGLFGTVWGIMGSFTGLASGSGATLETIAPGIAEALVTTVLGLAVAIPAVWFFNRLNNEMASVNNKMESFGQELLNRFERSTIFYKSNNKEED